MKHFRPLLFLLVLLPSLCHGLFGQQVDQRVSGWCEAGNKTITVQGVASSASTPVQRSYPSCTVTVYLYGTINLATIYSDPNRTSKVNPFTAGTDGSYFFYAQDGRYDVKISGGGLPSPFTTGDVQTFDYLYLQGASGSVARPLKEKAGEVVSVQDFGAKADCSTDDTAFLRNAAAYVNSLSSAAILFFPPGCYLVNPLEGTISGLAGYLLQITHNFTTVTGPGAVIKLAPGHDYAAELGAMPGQTFYWVYFQFAASHSQLTDISIDSNGQAQPTGTPQFWASGARFIKQGSSRTAGNSVSNVKFFQLGGWPVYAEYQDDFSIIGNYATGGEGFGVANGSSGFTIMGNTSRDAHDAHFYANGSAADIVYNGVISGNVGIANDNGSGIDVTGAENVVVSGNTLIDNQNWCILVDKTNGPYNHGAGDNPAKNISVTGNVCYNNSHYIGFGNDADIVVGDNDDTATTGQYAQNVTVTGNTIHTINPLGTGIEAGYGAANVTFDNNFVSGCGRAGLPCQYLTDIISVFRARGANDQIKVTNNHFAKDTRYQNQIQLDGSDTTVPYHIWGNTNSVLTFFYPLNIAPMPTEYLDVHTNLTAGAGIFSSFASAPDLQTKGSAPSGPSGEPHLRMYNGTIDSSHIRWTLGLCGTEGSSNSGADLCLYRYSNAGAFLGEQFRFERSDGRFFLDGNFDTQVIRAASLIIGGSTGATVSLSCPGGQAVKGLVTVGGAVISAVCGAP